MRIGIDAHFLEKHYGGLTTFLKGILGTLMDADLCRSERIDSDIKNEYYLFFQYRNPVRLTIDYPITQSPNYQMTQYRFPLWFNFVLPRQLKEHKIDLFFSPNHFLPILKVTKKEVVVIHDLAWKVNPALKNFSYRAYANIFQGRVIQRADKIVVDSENTKRDVMKYYSINELTSSNVNELEKKIEIVYLAADERFQARSISELNNSRVEELKNKYGLPEKFILYVGRIEERKNIKTVLKVIKYLSRLNKLRDLKLVMVGKIGAGGEKYLKEIKENQDILWLNGVSDENLPYIYNLAKIFLFPSFYEGFGIPCLPPETNIITREGIRAIKEIKIGEHVLTHLGRFKKVTKTLRRSYKGKIIEIQPYSFNSPIKLTPEHSVLAFKRPSKRWDEGRKRRIWAKQEPEWIPARDIKKGDCVIFPIPREEKSPKLFDLKDFDKDIKFDNQYVWYKMGYSPKDGKLLKVKRRIKVNEDLAKLIGIYIAEGSTDSKTFRSIEFSLGHEPNLAKGIKEAMKKVFGVDSLIIKGKNKLRVVVSGRIIAKFFSKLCGIGALNKKIAPLFLYGNKELLKVIVDYIYKGDGSKCKNRINFSTNSRQLTNDIKIALLRLNQRIWINNQKRKGKKNEEFSVQFSLSNIKNYTHSNKSWFLENKNFCAFLVRKVKKLPYYGVVYNLEVDEDNSYTAESFCVHNCLEAMQSGIPVLTSNTSSLPEVVGDGGLMHKPDDYEAFARDIIKLLQDEKFYKELKKKGLEQTKRFSWKETTKKLVAIFNKI